MKLVMTQAHSTILKHAENTVPSYLRCLRTIDSLPLDLSEALFVHYPSMKLGVSSAVDFYIDKLVGLALQSMQETPECLDWVITAPLFNTAPAAANLLCWKMYKKLSVSLPKGRELSLVDLHLSPQRMTINSKKDFKTYYEYSSNSVEQRVKERSQLHKGSDDIIDQGDAFTGKGVLIVNDIKVTGTQQMFMSQSFEQVNPNSLHWIYIFEVDKSLGIKHPQVEAQINNSSVQSLDEFSDVICSIETHQTARCVTRLFTYDMDDFKTLIKRLPTQKRQIFFHYATEEGRFEGDYFIEKYRVLRGLCENIEAQ